MNEQTNITGRELRESLGMETRTFQKKWKALFNYPSDANAPCTVDEIAAFKASLNTRKRRVPKENTMVAQRVESKEVSPAPKSRKAKAKFNWQAFRSATFNTTALSVVFGHAGLIWFDCATIWGIPGIIGGIITVAIVLLAVLLATDPEKQGQSADAMWTVFLIDGAAVYVHYKTFLTYMQPGEEWASLVFALFLCVCSAIALYLFRYEKND